MKNFNVGFLTALVVLTLVAFTCAKEESPVEPATTGSVRGNVIDNSTELALENAIIYTEPGSFQVSTDEYGDYRMNNVEPNDYKIYCYLAGYDTVYTNIKVVAGIESPANFRLTKKDTTTTPDGTAYGSITGLVRDYNTEVPLEKVLIKTSPSSSVVFTGTDGRFSISNVTPGEYRVTATKKDYDSSYVAITVTSGNESEANFNLTMKDAVDTTLLGKIRGKVTDLVTAEEIANVVVYTVPSSSTVLTDQSGNFLLNYLSPGTYKVIAEKNDYQSDTTSVVVQENLTSVASLTLKQISSTLGNIKGTVKDVFSDDPIQSVNVYTVPATNSVSTSASGEFSISNIPSGSYKVIAQKTDYFSDTTDVVVQSGLDVTADLYLKVSTGTLEGVILKASNGGPLNQATVKTIPSTNIVFTDITGKFLFEKLTPGTYKIITSHSIYQTDTTSVDIKAGVKTSATIVMNLNE